MSETDICEKHVFENKIIVCVWILRAAQDEKEYVKIESPTRFARVIQPV